MIALIRARLSSRLSLPALGGAIALLMALPAGAEGSRLQNEVGALRAELAALDGQVQLAQASGYDSDRLSSFERVVRELTGRVETVEHRLRQMSERLDRMEARLEQGGEEAAEPAAPSATYRPPQDEETPQGGPRVLGTPSDAFDEDAPRPSQAPAESQAAAEPDEEQQETGESRQAALPAGDAAAQYDQAFGLLRQAQWDEAETALQAFLEQHSDHRLAGNAKYWLGETHYVRGDYVAAARVFAEAFQQYPDSGKAPDNLLKLGMSLGALDRREDACGTLAELERRYSDAPAQILQRSRAERDRLGC